MASRSRRAGSRSGLEHHFDAAPRLVAGGLVPVRRAADGEQGPVAWLHPGRDGRGDPFAIAEVHHKVADLLCGPRAVRLAVTPRTCTRRGRPS
jgi:hypothetical protein